jgi:repressor of nif and glnA expression
MDARTVAYSLTLLQGKGLIERETRGNYRFTDNLFAEWLRVSDTLDQN